MEPKIILVVEDEEEMLELVEKKLTGEGYQVITSANGKDALEKAQKFIPNLILMDIVLPDTDGAEVVKALQSSTTTQYIPVIFLSGIVGAGESEAPEIKVGDQIYQAIGKPFTSEKLLSGVKSVLR